MTDLKFILASSSPRRIQLLLRLGLPIKIDPPRYEPNIITRDPIEKVRLTALEKARSVARYYTGGEIIIAADTVVVVDGRIIGKPQNYSQAKEYLKKILGKEHIIITGLAIVSASGSKEAVEHSISTVKFSNLSEEQLNKFISLSYPLDKAGGYAIQGLASFFIKELYGDFWNVVGFPIPLLYSMLKKYFDIDLLDIVRCECSLI